jgi:hypothetical protein
MDVRPGHHAILAILFAAVACDAVVTSPTPSGNCEAGLSISCACSDGRTGAQACNARGKWDACQCTGDMTNDDESPDVGNGDNMPGTDPIASDPEGTNGERACGLTFSDMQCASCVQGSCCTEAQACASNADCLAYIRCTRECGDERACLDRCTSDHPRGEALLVTLGQCMTIDCDARCGFTTYACGIRFTRETCATCMRESCCAQDRACAENPECMDFFQCVTACNSDDSCIDKCAVTHDGGVDHAAAVSVCYVDSCKATCDAAGFDGSASNEQHPYPVSAGLWIDPIRVSLSVGQ